MERFFGAPPLTTIPYVGAFEQNSQRRGKRSGFFYRRNKDIIHSSKRSEETKGSARSSSKTGRAA
jgi:hypothetical protein